MTGSIGTYPNNGTDDEVPIGLEVEKMSVDGQGRVLGALGLVH